MANPFIGLTQRQSRFVEEYIRTGNGSGAARAAGYAASKAGDISCHNLKLPKIQAALEYARKQLEKKTDITGESVILELAKIGFSNILDYVSYTEQGDPYVDISKVTRAQAAAICEVTVDDYIEGRGEDARSVKRVKIKMSDKRAALVDIGKHLGMFVEKKQVDLNVNAKPLSDDERHARLAELVGREATDRIIEAAGGGEEISGPPVTH